LITKKITFEVIVKDIDSQHAKISFDTAWSPPLPVITKLAKMFPDCRRFPRIRIKIRKHSLPAVALLASLATLCFSPEENSCFLALKTVTHRVLPGRALTVPDEKWRVSESAPNQSRS
jgi:hypothetical protein